MAKAEKAYINTYSFPASESGYAKPLKVTDVEDIDDEDTDPDPKPKRREDNTEVTKLLDNMEACVKEGDKSMRRLSKIADDTTRSIKRRDSSQGLRAVKPKKR